MLFLIDHSVVLVSSESESEWALLARYVYTYEEFVIVTEAPQCNRMTATGQDTDNKRTIQYTNRQCTNSKNTMQYRQSCVYRSDMCKFEMKKKKKNCMKRNLSSRYYYSFLNELNEF